MQAAVLVGWDGMASAPAFQEFVNDISTLLGKPPLAGAQRVPVPRLPWAGCGSKCR